jgi:hypothetical protein
VQALSAAVTIGDYQKTEELKGGLLLARLIVPANDFQLDWRRFSLVANYLAEYSAYHFEQKDRAENLISTVFYELIERLAATSRRDARLDIRFSAAAGWLLFELRSSFAAEELTRLRELLGELQAEDGEGYYQRLLAADLETEANRRKLGLAMVAHDYHARLSGLLDAADGSVLLRALVSEEEIRG